MAAPANSRAPALFRQLYSAMDCALLKRLYWDWMRLRTWRPNLDIETEMDHVTVLHDVFLAL